MDNSQRIGYIPKVGKPPSYTPQELEIKINEYFQWVNDENVERKKRRFEGEKFKPFTLSGICVYLGISRETWSEYGKKSEYVDTIKKTRAIVENYVEEGLMNGTINAIGGIFNLKNNFGWVDKIDIATTSQPEQLTPTDIRSQIEQRKNINQDDDQNKPK